MNIFVDTNILVDLIADRKPFSKYAIQLFDKAEKREVSLFVSSHSVATTHYLLKKYVSEKQLRAILYDLLDFVTVIPIDIENLKRGLLSNHKDFEDALQINCAESMVEMDFIVTRNIKDFQKSNIQIVNPEELSKILKS
jgi:predicted nucleic acid-binding protein